MAYINIFFLAAVIFSRAFGSDDFDLPTLPTGPLPSDYINWEDFVDFGNAENADFDVDIFSTDINRHNQLSQEKAPVDSDYKFLQSATIGTEERDRNPRKKARISHDEYPTDVPTIHNEESKIIFPSKNYAESSEASEEEKEDGWKLRLRRRRRKLRTKYVEIPEDYDQEVDAENDVFKAKAPFVYKTLCKCSTKYNYISAALNHMKKGHNFDGPDFNDVIERIDKFNVIHLYKHKCDLCPYRANIKRWVRRHKQNYHGK